MDVMFERVAGLDVHKQQFSFWKLLRRWRAKRIPKRVISQDLRLPISFGRLAFDIGWSVPIWGAETGDDGDRQGRWFRTPEEAEVPRWAGRRFRSLDGSSGVGDALWG
jgi:hypothetical protein